MKFQQQLACQCAQHKCHHWQPDSATILSAVYVRTAETILYYYRYNVGYIVYCINL